MHLQEVTSWERPLLKITKITFGTATVVLLSIVFECNLSRTSAVTHWVHLEEPTSLLEAEQTLASLLVFAVFFHDGPLDCLYATIAVESLPLQCD